MKRKVYTAWTKGEGQKTEVMTEWSGTSTKEFRRMIEERGGTVTSRIRVKKS